MRLSVRHLVAGASGASLIYAFWLTRPQWDPEMRLWKAVGDSSLMLLYATVSIGPAVRLWPRAARLISYRRETGIWFGLLALVHTLLILNGWARWDVSRFFGYEFIPQLDRVVRMEPGFGLANLVGFVAVLMTIPLVATSTDWATRKLGGSAWKFLHNATYVIFWLVVLHTAYFLFIHYTASFHRLPPPPDWARLPFAGVTLAVISVQAAAFVATVRRRSAAGQRSRYSVDPEGLEQPAAASPRSMIAAPSGVVDLGIDANTNGRSGSPVTRAPRRAVRKRGRGA